MSQKERISPCAGLELQGPGKHWQWKPTARKDASGAAATADLPDIMMLTADMALLEDPEYLRLVKIFSQDQGALDKAFGHGEPGC
jgi:catalase (peroxidase I)